jgi:hypothetical protein
VPACRPDTNAGCSYYVPVATKIDYSALLFPVNRDEVASFRAQAKSTSPVWSSMATGQLVTVIFSIVVASIALLVFGFVAFGMLVTALGSSGNPAALVGPILVVLAIAASAVLGALYLNRTFGASSWEKWMRATRFAEANNLVYSPRDADPNYPGMIFHHGSNRTVSDHYRSKTGRFLDIGTMRFVTGSGKSRTTHTWGFMALSLDRALPNMVLDARSNNKLFGYSNLPQLFSKDQILHLEGDFDQHFTLYCPVQYERDALYVFTPDLMALLIDEAAPFDVEIVDTWMFVYSSAPVDPVKPAVLDRYFRIVETVGAKTLHQTQRYADERIGDPAVNMVAPQGQRLRSRIPVLAIVIIGLWAATWIVPQLLSFFR